MLQLTENRPFFDGISDEFSAGIWRFGKSFRIFHANFVTRLPSLPSF
jgi:hypothetical protein